MTSAHGEPVDDEMLTPVEVYSQLGIKRRTLDRWVADGKLSVAHRLPNGHRRFSARAVRALRQPDHPAPRPGQK